MLLLDLIEWVHEHPGEFLYRSVLLIFLRNLIHLAKEEEIHWIRERVERLTGERYPGHTKRLWRRVVRSFVILSSYLLMGKRPATTKRRVKTMNQNINWATLAPCLLGAGKLILQPMGINIPDENLNEIANGIAALATVIGIIYSHRKQGGASSVSTQPTDLISNNK